MPAILMLWTEQTAKNKIMPILQYCIMKDEIFVSCFILPTVLVLFPVYVNAMGNAHLTQFRKCISEQN